MTRPRAGLAGTSIESRVASHSDSGRIAAAMTESDPALQHHVGLSLSTGHCVLPRFLLQQLISANMEAKYISHTVICFTAVRYTNKDRQDGSTENNGMYLYHLIAAELDQSGPHLSYKSASSDINKEIKAS